jgi:uncharacterized membrane protein YdjX (TVP38/TMEM64 family)
MRNWLVFGILAVFIIIPFLIWGDWFTRLFSEEGSIEILKRYGSWAWMIAILLLIGDLFLPLPATVIMAALGFLYGPLWGGLLAALGGFLSGVLAFSISRGLGRKGALWILGEKDLAKGERTFSRNGGWIVAISRWLPVLPEIVACMAGLNRMPWRPFLLALACGSLPLGFVFAYIGYTGVEYPLFAIIVSAGLPPVLWLIAQYFLRSLADRGSAT